MPDDTGQEKTEQATQKRRQETRRKGQVARSAEVNSAVMLLAGFSVILIFRQHILMGFEGFFNGIFSQLNVYDLNINNTNGILLRTLSSFFSILFPIFIVMALVGILVNILQVGFLFTAEPITPKLEKINPVEGLKRIFSRRSLETLIRDIIKIVIVLWIGLSAIKGIMNNIMTAADSGVGDIFAFTGNAVFSIAMKILIGYFVIAALDYAFQRWDYERSMMMTRQEIREEMKQTEGDPLLRARVRSVQRELSRRRMMEAVPKAEVVITNPTHIAVALSYGAGMTAPVVVAKGKNLIAEKIRSVAEEAGVPIVENILLAQSLYKAVDIGNPIPAELYTAVAEVLAYVYRISGKKVV
ncbi:MAG: flagellar biosynthesis protein FlhB [Candidatus Latescibacteria bacterium]|nr:flagellar biosynthesis protein FlhB [Candidatus Latescibacterota bacterium]